MRRSTNVNQDIWMVLSTTSSLDTTAPGMVMLDLQRESKYPVKVVGYSSTKQPLNDDHILVKPNLLVQTISKIISLFPYNLKKDWFITNHFPTITYYLSVMLLVVRKKPDVILVHVGYALCWLIKWINPKIEVVYYHHGGNMHTKLSLTHWKRLVKSCPQLIISVSLAAVNGCRETFNQFPKTFKVIHNGVHSSSLKITNPYSKQDIFGIENPFVFCYAGRMNRSKGLDILIDVFTEISLKHAQARLLLIGAVGNDSTEQENMLFLEKIKLIHGKVFITGKVPKTLVSSYQSLSDAGVLVSMETEGNSLFAIESLHLGIPLILTNKGGNSEILDTTNPPGLLIEVNDSIRLSLFEAMDRLISDKMLMIQFRQHAIQRSAYFTATRMANEFDNTIATILNE